LKFGLKKGPYVVFLAIVAINLNVSCPYAVRNQKEVSSILATPRTTPPAGKRLHITPERNDDGKDDLLRCPRRGDKGYWLGF
jgi:hypothetical protein